MGLADKETPTLHNYIIDYYNSFLGKFKDNTSKNYRTDLKLFFEQMFDKSPEHITIEDIQSTTSLHAMKYYQYLIEIIEVKGEKKPRYANASVNRKINAIKSFFRFLNRDYKDISDNIFENIDLPSPDLDSKGWDGLDWQEAIMIWEYAQDNFDEESNQLSMLFKLASVTSIRLDALLNAIWEKHWYIKNERGISINYIEVIDKDKKHKKPISESFFNELQEKLGSKGKMFPNMYPNKVGDYLKLTTKALGFDSRRRIVFHSFKKAGVMRALEKTGNMYKAKEQGNHSSMNTAEKYYLKYKECLVDMVSYTLDSEIDVKEELSEYNKDELIEAISKMSDGSKYELLRILKG